MNIISEQSNFSNLNHEIDSRLSGLNVSDHEKRYIKELDFQLATEGLDLNDKALEKLRLACQLWDVDLKHQPIESHRKFIGPLIVAVKKVFAPIIRYFLKDFIRQQKDFNASIVALTVEALKKQR